MTFAENSQRPEEGNNGHRQFKYLYLLDASKTSGKNGKGSKPHDLKMLRSRESMALHEAVDRAVEKRRNVLRMLKIFRDLMDKLQ